MYGPLVTDHQRDSHRRAGGVDTFPSMTTASTTIADVGAIVDDPRRVVTLDAVHNFRDLGGYALGDGRVTGWGRMFRADGLYRLTTDDLPVLDALGIRTVIDLRSSAEVEQYGSYPVARHPVAFHSLPIIDVTWHDADTPEVTDDEAGAIEFLTWAYNDMLDQGADRFAHAIQVLALPSASPSVFHCAAGKDRTGVLAALVLSGLGVDLDVVVADYALTEAGMNRMRAWVDGQDSAMAERMRAMPSFMLAAHPQAMRNLLEALISRHGSIPQYLSTIGIGDATLDALATVLTT